MAADTDTIAVGDPTAGNVFIYTLKPGGSWSKPTALLPVSSPRCCSALTLAADTLVTHTACEEGGVCENGRPVVFFRSEGRWALQATINATLPGTMHLGRTLILTEAGDTLAVGKVIYFSNGTAWSLQQTLEHTHNGSVEEYGVRAMSGNLLVDAYGYVDFPDNACFQVNVWARETPGGLYIRKARLDPPVASSGRWGFYGSVAGASEDLIAVAEPGYGGSQYSAPLLGSVYIFNSELLGTTAVADANDTTPASTAPSSRRLLGQMIKSRAVALLGAAALYLDL